MTNPATWMTETYQAIANVPLYKLSMPGSHDAGISVLHFETAASTPCNTQTQEVDIAGQLAAGSRYFDIRPLVASSVLYGMYTQHMNTIANASQQGAAGQCIESVLGQVSDFLNQPGCEQEIVILKFSGYRNYDAFLPSHSGFSNDQFRALLDQVAARLANQLYTDANPNINLAELTPAQIVAGSGRVITVFDYPMPLELYKSTTGVFQYADYNTEGYRSGVNLIVFDQYSDTDHLNWMQASQLGKFINFPAYQNAQNMIMLFLASWTLTLQRTDNVNPFAKCISDLAACANATLCEQISAWQAAGYAVTGATVPNIIYHDYVLPSDGVAALCVQLNPSASARN
jgi:hypothetical protein